MLYFTRQLLMPNNDEGEQNNTEVAKTAYLERLEEIRADLPKSVRKLLDDPDWASTAAIQFVDNHFNIASCDENILMLTDFQWCFIFRYTIDEVPLVEAPNEEEQEYFTTDTLNVLYNEWDLNKDNVLVHRLLLSNGYIITYKPKEFRWWKTKIEAEA